MQFPRGRFTAMKKGTRICDLLEELKHSRFSGYCIITHGTETGSLVLKNGNCLLAGYQDIAGDDAWISIQRIEESEVDVQIIHLTPAQLNLTLEFNQGARIERNKKHQPGEMRGDMPVRLTTKERESRTYTPEPRKSRRSPEREAEAAVPQAFTATHGESPPAGMQQEGAPPAEQAHVGGPAQVTPDQIVPPGPDTGTGISSGHQETGGHAPSLPGDPPLVLPEVSGLRSETDRGSPVPPISEETGAEQGPGEQSGFQHIQSPAGDHEEEKSPHEGFIRELSALDAMDLPGMTEKIRNNCRAIVKGLHLEHLLDWQEDKPQ
jgi:hypothetical protein